MSKPKPGEPQPYQWSYDRSPLDTDPRGFTTLSVGVYQWLPKAGGKGLKQSKSIRVMGYTAEPQRVYDKADELCRRLNEAGARIDAPPKWLQKQYSVPKPAGMVTRRSSDDELTGAQVRSLRQQVMKQRLLPAGFVQGEGATYVRRAGDQIHLIDFQSHKWGHQFTVNLGFSYAWVPPPFHGRRVALHEYDELDCLLSARLGFFLKERKDTWFEYGEDRDDLRAVLERCADESLKVLDRAGKRWEDPATLLKDAAAGKARPWGCDCELALACVNMRAGRLKEAERILRGHDWEPDRGIHEFLAKKLASLREGASAAWEDWASLRSGETAKGKWVLQRQSGSRVFPLAGDAHGNIHMIESRARTRP